MKDLFYAFGPLLTAMLSAFLWGAAASIAIGDGLFLSIQFEKSSFGDLVSLGTFSSLLVLIMVASSKK